MSEELVLNWIVFGGIGAVALGFVIGGAHAARADWKRLARHHEKTLEGIAQLDPAFAKVFGRRKLDMETLHWVREIDGEKIQRLAGVSRRKNDRAEDATALKDALRELANERKVR